MRKFLLSAIAYFPGLFAPALANTTAVVSGTSLGIHCNGKWTYHFLFAVRNFEECTFYVEHEKKFALSLPVTVRQTLWGTTFALGKVLNLKVSFTEKTVDLSRNKTIASFLGNYSGWIGGGITNYGGTEYFYAKNDSGRGMWTTSSLLGVSASVPVKTKYEVRAVNSNDPDWQTTLLPAK